MRHVDKPLLWLVTSLALVAACQSPPDPPNPGESEEEYSGALNALIARYENAEITRAEFVAQIRAWPSNQTVKSLGGRLENSLVLRETVVSVADGFTVAPGSALVMAPGSELVLADAAQVIVEGRFYSMGETEEEVRITSASSYEEILLRGVRNEFVQTEFSRAERLLHVAEADTTQRTLIESSRFEEWSDVAVSQSGSSELSILSSAFGLQTESTELLGETIRTRNAGGTHIEGNEFGARRGYRDVIDLQDCDPDDWPSVIRNDFLGGEDDAIDLDNCSAWVVGNYIRDFRPADLDVQVAGVNGGGITGDGEGSRPILINNIIQDCFHGIGFKNGAQPQIHHNTLRGNNIGITLYQSAQGKPSPVALGRNNILVDNLDWRDQDAQDLVLNGRWWRIYNQVDPVQGSIDLQQSITASGNVVPGSGNLNDDPLLEDAQGIPIPGTDSPARNQAVSIVAPQGADALLFAEYLKTDFLGNPRPAVQGDLGAVQAPVQSAHSQ